MEANRRPLSSRDYRWVQALARWLAAQGVSPNSISIMGMVFATAGAALYAAAAKGWPITSAGLVPGRPSDLSLVGAALCIPLRLLCNLLDGLVAVEGGRKGKAGDLFNEAPDRYADVLLLAGAGLAAGHLTLGWAAATFAVGTAYVRALGASLGQGQDFGGPFAKQQRMFVLTVGTLAGVIWTPVFHWSLWLIAAGTLFTFARRIDRLYRRLP